MESDFINAGSRRRQEQNISTRTMPPSKNTDATRTEIISSGSVLVYKGGVVNNTTFPDIYATITPYYVANRSPSSFTSKKGTDASEKITVTFSSPVAQVSIKVVDSDFSGNTIEYYGMDGSILYTNNVPFDNTVGNNNRTNVTWPATLNSGSSITKLVLVPGNGDYVYYDDLTVIPLATPAVAVPSPSPTPSGVPKTPTIPQNLPNVINYTPLQPDTSLIPCKTVEDMISYNITRTRRTINYNIGELAVFEWNLTIKNITTNGVVELDANKLQGVFIVTRDSEPTSVVPSASDRIVLRLNPQESVGLRVKLNKQYLDRVSTRTIPDANLALPMRNVSIVDPVYKSNTPGILPIQNMQSIINVGS